MASVFNTDDILRGQLDGWYSVIEHGSPKRVVVRVVRYVGGHLYAHCPRRYITKLGLLRNRGRFSRWMPLLPAEIPTKPSYT